MGTANSLRGPVTSALERQARLQRSLTAAAELPSNTKIWSDVLLSTFPSLEITLDKERGPLRRARRPILSSTARLR